MADLFAELAKTETGRNILDRIAESMPSPLGKGDIRYYRTCRDGWTIARSFGRVVGGKHHGKYLVLAYKPVGPGSRSRNPRRTAAEWALAYSRGFASRKASISRAETLFLQHDARR